MQCVSKCLTGIETIASGIFLKDLDRNSTFILLSFAMTIDADHVIIALLGSGRVHCRPQVVELIVTVKPGAKGLVTWDAPTTQGIMAGPSRF